MRRERTEPEPGDREGGNETADLNLLDLRRPGALPVSGGRAEERELWPGEVSSPGGTPAVPEAFEGSGKVSSSDGLRTD